jgi:hypothetical protein
VPSVGTRCSVLPIASLVPQFSVVVARSPTRALTEHFREPQLSPTGRAHGRYP